jgi:WD40 repeat protein
MKYWDLEARKMIKDFKCVKHSYTKLFFNPGDSTLYALSNQPDDVNKIFYWKINDSIKSNSINNTKSISNFTISEHSKYLATYSTDSVLKVYNLLTKDLLYSQNLPKMPQQISFSPDEEVLAIGWNSFIRFLSAKTGDYDTTIYTQKPKISSLKWKPNSKILSYTGFDDDFVLWDMDLRQTILNQSMYNSKITSVDWSQDGKFVALGADAGNLIIWNSENNQVYTGFQFDTSISEVKWHPLENKLAIIQKNKPIKFWDMTSEKVTDTISPLYSNISSFAWGLGDESIYYADDIGVIVNTNIKNISTTDDLILSKSDLKIYPNPTSSILFFNYSLETNSHVIITIVDALGNEAYQKDLGFVDKGENSYFLDTDNMAQGFYFIRVQKNGISEIGKFGVIR